MPSWGQSTTAAPALDATASSSLMPFLQGQPGQGPSMQAAIDAFNSGTLPLIQQQLQLQGLGQSPMVASIAAGALGQNLVPLIQGDQANRLAAAQQMQNLYLGKGNLDISGRAQTLAEQMQPAQIGVQREQNANTRYATDVQRDLGMGNLGLGYGQLGVQRELGLGGLENQRYGTDVQRELGLGNLDLQSNLGAAGIANDQAQRQLQAYGMAGNMFLGLSNPYAAAQAGQLQQQQTALTGYSQAGQAQQGVGQGAMDARQMEMLRLMGLSEAGTTGLFGGSVLPPSMGQTGTSTNSGGSK